MARASQEREETTAKRKKSEGKGGGLVAFERERVREKGKASVKMVKEVLMGVVQWKVIEGAR